MQLAERRESLRLNEVVQETDDLYKFPFAPLLILSLHLIASPR